MKNKEKIEYLNGLIADIDCLEPLYKWINEINIFNILKIDNFEIRHSNMLAWLLNPNNMHGIGDKLLKKFLIYATRGTNLKIMKNLTPIEVDLFNWDDVVVDREQNDIDILIVSEENKIVCAIENKTQSSEHDDQLNRYREFLQDKYGDDYKYVLIFLSPEGVESSDSENWVSMRYQFVLEELEKIVSIYKIPEKAKLYIDDYIQAIRRLVVEDKELKELCYKIYYQHQDAFDLIFENRPNFRGEISTYIYKYLVEHAKEYDITVWNEHSDCYVRFTPNKLVEIYGKMGSEEWYHSQNLIAFEIQNFKDVNLAVKVIVGPSKPEFSKYRQLIVDKAIGANYKMKGKKLTNKWKTVKSDDLVNKERLNCCETELIGEIVRVPLEKYLSEVLPQIVKDLS